MVSSRCRGICFPRISNIRQRTGTVPPALQKSGLVVQPAKAQPNEPVTVTISVTNNHNTWGIYGLVLKINGVQEAQTQVEVNAGATEKASFVVARERPGRYSLFINGLSGTLYVR